MIDLLLEFEFSFLCLLLYDKFIPVHIPHSSFIFFFHMFEIVVFQADDMKYGSKFTDDNFEVPTFTTVSMPVP